jgi:Family of unknown function (DUF6251)
MSTTPKRYQFDNPTPSFEPRPLPARRPDAPLVEPYEPQYPAQYAQQQPQQVIVQHIHQAPPDRVLQRLALGCGIGAGATTTAVYFGPLLVASMEMVAITFLIGGLVIAVLAWSIVSVVGSLKPTAPPTGRKRRR